MERPNTRSREGSIRGERKKLNDEIEQLIKKQREELKDDYEKLKQPFLFPTQTNRKLEVQRKGNIDDTLDFEEPS